MYADTRQAVLSENLPPEWIEALMRQNNCESDQEVLTLNRNQIAHYVREGLIAENYLGGQLGSENSVTVDIDWNSGIATAVLK